MPLAKNIGPTILDIGHGNDFGFDGGDPCEDRGGGGEAKDPNLFHWLIRLNC